MNVVVKLRSSGEEKVLLAFLDSLAYDYQTQANIVEPTDDENPVREWEEIKKDLLNLFS